MSEVWTKWLGYAVNGTLPLQRFLGGSDHSGVFVTRLPGREPIEVAIKLVPAIVTFGDSLLSRWDAAVGLSHPHLLRILETGRCQLDGHHYLFAVMEYADQTLAQLLEQRAMSADEAREMLPSVLNALAFLHNRNLVQGQLKPTNVLVVGEQIKLASDTVRKVSDAAAANMMSAYDPPEMQDGVFSTAGDIWALGVTLFEALTRRSPLDLNVRPEGVVLPPDFPAPFREMVSWCLSRRPYDRPKVGELDGKGRGQGGPSGAASAPRAPGGAGSTSAAREASQSAPAPVSAAREASQSAPAPEAVVAREVSQSTPASASAPREASHTASAPASGAREAPRQATGGPHHAPTPAQHAPASPQPAPRVAAQPPKPVTSPAPAATVRPAPVRPQSPLTPEQILRQALGPARVAPQPAAAPTPQQVPRAPRAAPQAAQLAHAAAPAAAQPAMRSAPERTTTATGVVALHSTGEVVALREPTPHRESVPHREPALQRESVPQREPMPQREPVPHREPLPQRDLLPQRESVPRREPLPPRVPSREPGRGEIVYEHAVFETIPEEESPTANDTSAHEQQAAHQSEAAHQQQATHQRAGEQAEDQAEEQERESPTRPAVVPLTVATIAVLALIWAFGVRFFHPHEVSDPQPVEEAPQGPQLPPPAPPDPSPITDEAAQPALTESPARTSPLSAPQAQPQGLARALPLSTSQAHSQAPTGTQSQAIAQTPPATLKPTSNTTSVVASQTTPPAADETNIHEEIPSVPGVIRHTIRGHVRVAVRIIVDKDGTVFAALIDQPGPSRYFERVAIEAAKKWTFPPMDAQGLKLVRFDFTRDGATGQVTSVE